MAWGRREGRQGWRDGTGQEVGKTGMEGWHREGRQGWRDGTGQEVGKTGREGWHRAGGREDREGGMAQGRR